MPKPSTLASLSETLEKKRANDLQQVEQLTTKELQRLANVLRKRSNDVLSSTLSDIESSLNRRLNQMQKQIKDQTEPMNQALASVRKEAQSLQRLTLRAWMKPMLIGLCLLGTISLGSWGLTLYLSSTIQTQLQQIETQKMTLQQLESQTWGVSFSEGSNGRFLVLPKGVKPETGWTVGDKQAIRLGAD